MPGRRVKKVGQASKEKELNWINCEECGRLELEENSEAKEDNGDPKDAGFQCRLCQMEGEISSVQKEVKAKMGKIEKQIVEISKKQKELEERQAEIIRDIGLKVESEAVEPMLDRMNALEAAQAELVVSVSEMKGEWPTISEANAWTVVKYKNGGKDVKEREGEIVRVARPASAVTSRTLDDGGRGKKEMKGVQKENEVKKGRLTGDLGTKTVAKKASKKLYNGASALPFRKAGAMRSKQAGTNPKLTALRNNDKAAIKRKAAEEGGERARTNAVKDTGSKRTGKAGAKKGETVETKVAVNVKHTVTKTISFKEKCKDLKEGTVVLVGDSMIRGVGEKLRRDNTMFTPIANGGARIESVTWSLKNKQVKVLRDDSHLVVMVGTNNLKGEGTEMIMSKYKDLIDTMKEVMCRKLTMVGILARGDENEYLESKRIGLNQRLGHLCAMNGVEFVEPSDVYDIISAGRSAQERRRMETQILNRWGLHLNEWGQDQVARVLFKHCLKYLN